MPAVLSFYRCKALPAAGLLRDCKAVPAGQWLPKIRRLPALPANATWASRAKTCCRHGAGMSLQPRESIQKAYRRLLKVVRVPPLQREAAVHFVELHSSMFDSFLDGARSVELQQKVCQSSGFSGSCAELAGALGRRATGFSLAGLDVSQKSFSQRLPWLQAPRILCILISHSRFEPSSTQGLTRFEPGLRPGFKPGF